MLALATLPHSLPTMKRLLFTSLLLSALTLPCSLMAQDAKAKGKGKAKAKRPDAVGPAIGANVATPVSNIKTLKDFKVELIYSVPGGEQGSWVNRAPAPRRCRRRGESLTGCGRPCPEW